MLTWSAGRDNEATTDIAHDLRFGLLDNVPSMYEFTIMVWKDAAWARYERSVYSQRIKIKKRNCGEILAASRIASRTSIQIIYNDLWLSVASINLPNIFDVANYHVHSMSMHVSLLTSNWQGLASLLHNFQRSLIFRRRPTRPPSSSLRSWIA